jgi:hypothetical protein
MAFHSSMAFHSLFTESHPAGLGTVLETESRFLQVHIRNGFKNRANP